MLTLDIKTINFQSNGGATEMQKQFHSDNILHMTHIPIPPISSAFHKGITCCNYNRLIGSLRHNWYRLPQWNMTLILLWVLLLMQFVSWCTVVGVCHIDRLHIQPGLAIFLIFFKKSKKSDLFDLNQIFWI